MLKTTGLWMRGAFRSLLYRFFFFFLVVSLLIQFINFITYRVNLWYFETELEHNYNKSLSNIAAGLNNVFTGIYNSNYLLSLDGEAMQLFSSSFDVDSPSKYAVVSQTIRSLNRIRLMSDYVDSVFIYKKQDDLIISDHGTISAKDFFGRSSALEQYPESFWKNYGRQSQPFQILTPSRSVSRNGAYILPIVQTSIAEYRSNDLYVINLKVDPIIQSLNSSKLTPNSRLFIVDDNQQLIASTDMNEPKGQFFNFVNQFQASGTSVLRTKVEGKDMLAIQMNTRFVFKNLHMVALVPVSDIRASMKNVQYWGTFLSLLALVLSVLLSFLFSRKLYGPIHSLIVKISPSAVPAADEYKLLDREINRMMNNMDTLSNSLSSLSPLALEQWIVRLLRLGRIPDEQEISSFLNKCGLSFGHDHFAAVLIRAKLGKAFYMDYSAAEQNTYYDKMVSVLKSNTPANHQSYLVEIEANVFCLLVNFPQAADRHELADYFESMLGLFRHDEILHDVFVGVGDIHKGFDGLQQSYLEAMKAMWRLSPFENKRLHYYEKEDEESVTILLNNSDDKKIFNLLASVKRDELHELLGKVIRNHVAMGLNDFTIKELYMHLFVIGSQVLKHKDKTLPEATYREYIRMILSEHSISIDGMTEFISGYFNQIMDAVEPKANQLESLVFKPFIDANYQEDIHLEVLAEKFHTTANYMSRLLKKELGKPFHQYLQEVRIQKAKELLANSNRTIQDIWASVGFNNRNSFIRSFRKIEGISPMEYRLQHSSNSEAKVQGE
ncbi:helix-turn-helix domain-containing protein [Paenibacillus beijingensis]|uniref:HTH araC/xylS-type domain-containing protein n=1 Tax=Paenibacillus beijingensis TaxID=1126833 RepID=A0A0D5NIE3_9BACL|nr:helix-turn-helix domain-containing protein [Paenibacillus beijingensis]AJY74742.1 hypothetical protein VN24_09285 [Paenibacillus beijingensis]